MEATYVLNPLDTHEKWEKSFKQFYVPDAGDIIEYLEKKGYGRDEKYSMLVEAESSGRTCAGTAVVSANPVSSMFEIATDRPYQALRPLSRPTDLLWFGNYITGLQANLN